MNLFSSMFIYISSITEKLGLIGSKISIDKHFLKNINT